MERHLRDTKILETVERLQKRVADRFPGSGLSGVAGELAQVTREAVARAASIREPNNWIRGGLVLVALLALFGVVRHFVVSPDLRAGFRELIDFADATKGFGVYLVAAVVFLITLEIRFKRRKALRAIHELRAMAHLVDMHQLSKAPDRIGSEDGPRMDDGKLMTTEEVRAYLNYCTELLANLSKIGQLYVQDFPDAPAGAAVDQFENLATGLTGKIWQKIMILDRLADDELLPPDTGRLPSAPAGV
jgi:hypothetical protein